MKKQEYHELEKGYYWHKPEGEPLWDMAYVEQNHNDNRKVSIALFGKLDYQVKDCFDTLEGEFVGPLKTP